MARKPTGNPVGPPKKIINWEEFEKLCAFQCTQDEMANFFHVCGPTLSLKVKEKYGEEYMTIYKRFADEGKCSLRRHQFVMSKKSAAMAIWLGKQWLGQKENIPEVQVNDEINKRFVEIMNQIGQFQLDRKIAESNNNNAPKS